MSGGKAVAGFFVLLLGLFIAGGLYVLYDEGLIDLVYGKYWIPSDWLELMLVGWHVVPIIIMIVFVMSAAAVGLYNRRRVTE